MACSSSYLDNVSGVQDSFPIAAVFREYYDQVGGENVLGKPISPPVQEENFVYQYTVNAVLVKATNLEHQTDVLLSPVGLDLTLPKYKAKSPIYEGSFYVNNVAVYDEFISLFQKLGGESRVGNPLTSLRYNPLKKRYEQLFESVGFYFTEADPKGMVKLLAYGVWKCQSACIYPYNKEAEVTQSNVIDPHFIAFVDQVGSDFTGFAITDAFQTNDGKIQQVFENLALEYIPNQDPAVVLMNIPTSIGILSEQMVNKTSQVDQVFIPIKGEKGHNIPRQFLDYINLHGGLDVIGLPINEASQVGNQTFWQCFEKLCIEKDGRLAGVYQIHPSALGLEYLYLHNPKEENTQDKNTPTLTSPQPRSTLIPPTLIPQEHPFEMNLRQAHAWVDANTPQEIRLVVTKNHIPIEGISPYLIIIRPDGEPIRFAMPATDAQGVSVGQIPAITAPNGTLISYKVCIKPIDFEEQCEQGGYPIWVQP